MHQRGLVRANRLSDEGGRKPFAEQGEDVDFLWCSSDPDSLGRIVLKKRRIALLDGTAPHVVDPQNPGAVDEILNLGEYWVSDRNQSAERIGDLL